MGGSGGSSVTDYTLSAGESQHRVWDSDIEPSRTVESGSVVQFDCQPGSGDDIAPGMSAEEAASKPFPGHCLTGPVAVEGLEPGDLLHVEILDVTAGDWGYTLVRGDSDRGLLPDLLDDPFIHHWDIGDTSAEFVDGIHVPIDPFPGTLGIVPAGDSCSTIPPRRVGGNLDIKYLTAGSELWLPVAVEGGLFSIGDGHAAQGDGEVCLTAIETDISVTVRLTRQSGRSIDSPQYRVPETPVPDGPVFATTGVADSLMDAARSAIGQLVDHLQGEYSLDTAEAYVLCSVAADLKINEVVNEPHYVVSAHLPESILSSDVALSGD